MKFNNEQKKKEYIHNHIQVGSYYKSYKALCEAIGEKPKGGNSKYKQLEDINRYLKIQKDRHGNGYTIIEIYDKIQPKKVKDNAIFTKTIELILLIEAKQKGTNVFTFTKTQLFELLGMINENFLYKNREILKNILIENSFEKEEDLQSFQLRIWKKLTNLLESAFRSLERRSMMMAQKIYTIVYSEKGYLKYKEATEEEVEYILQKERETLNELGIAHKPFYNITNFYNKLNRKIKEEKSNWVRAYKEYKLIWNTEYIDSTIDRIQLEMKELMQKHQLELNSNVIDSLNTQAKDIQEKKKKEIEGTKIKGIGFKNSDIIERQKIRELDKNYLNIQKRLTDLFIKIGINTEEYIQNQYYNTEPTSNKKQQIDINK